MREILFRGKRTDNGEWIEGALYCYYDFKRTIVQILTDRTNGRPDAYEVIPETMGQFTGMTDKNGKKIFEGDIVRKGFENFVVNWNAEQCRFDLYTKTNYIQSGFNVYTQKFLEVIGNIHDNPELLKGRADNA